MIFSAVAYFRRILLIITALLLSFPAAASDVSGQKPQLMIVGVPHFANPGRDVAKTDVEDVFSAQRQREIEAIVEALAAFRPTHVAVEWDASKQEALDQRYAAYLAGTYELTRNEVDQLGLRLAKRLGLKRVDAVDWGGDAPGKPNDYNYVAWLEANGRGDVWADFQKTVQAYANAEQARHRCQSIADWIRGYAEPATLFEMAQPYYDIATFGTHEDNPGAAWVSSWYLRNLRIFNYLRDIGGAPGRRTVAIFGAGHAPLLRDNARGSGVMELVEPADYLPPSRGSTCAAEAR